MTVSLREKVVLITGGTSGIGRATAVAFARAGAKVVVSGRREAEGSETLTLIKNFGGEGKFVQGDITSEVDIAAMVKTTVDTFGRLDCAFNNAGIEGQWGLLVADQTIEEYRKVFDVNVRGVLLSMKYEIPEMLKVGGGAIVNTASVAGTNALPGVVVYVGSKHAVIGLTRERKIFGSLLEQ